MVCIFFLLLVVNKDNVEGEKDKKLQLRGVENVVNGWIEDEVVSDFVLRIEMRLGFF